jgi:hypothetical protein
MIEHISRTPYYYRSTIATMTKVRNFEVTRRQDLTNKFFRPTNLLTPWGQVVLKELTV